MSRSISIGYRKNGRGFEIEVSNPYFLLGGQDSSKQFWSIPRLKEVGISNLTVLGDSDPVDFEGWGKLADLSYELDLLQMHLESIPFHTETKTQWLTHFTHCYYLLIQTAPRDSIPVFSIG